MADLRVAIVGGGIGGLAAAIALRAGGVDVQVFEQAAELTEVGAGLGLSQNALRMLDRVGVAARIAEVGAPTYENVILRGDGQVITSHASQDGKALSIGVHRADLIDVFASFLPDGIIHTGHRCVDFTQDESSATVTFESGKSYEADIVVGADGIHSMLRGRVVDQTPATYSGAAAYRSLIPMERVPLWPKGGIRMFMGEAKGFVSYGCRRNAQINLVGYYFTGDQSLESWVVKGDTEEFAARFASLTDPLARELIAGVDETFITGLHDRHPLERWTNGRLTLLGDAAHAMLPTMGQGANQSIEDGIALAALLRDATPQTAPDRLVKYQVVRRARTAPIQLACHDNLAMMKRGEQLKFGFRPALLDYDAEAEALAV